MNKATICDLILPGQDKIRQSSPRVEQNSTSNWLAIPVFQSQCLNTHNSQVSRIAYIYAGTLW